MSKVWRRSAAALLVSTGLMAGALVAPTIAAATAQHSGFGRFRGIITANTQPGRAFGAQLRSRHLNPQVGRAARRSANLSYWGGPVMHSDANYAIYWNPGGYSYSPNYATLVNNFFTNVAAASGASSNVYSVATQYSDSSGSVTYGASFSGSMVDTDPYPASGCNASPVCITDAQLQTEISHVISAQNLPTGMNRIYFVFFPANVNTCFDSGGAQCSTNVYCAYHSNIGSGSAGILYANMGYAGTSGCESGQSPSSDPAADSVINLVSHENIEALTDPLGNAWFDNSGNEIGDKCAWNFGSPLGGRYGAEYNQAIVSGDYWLQQEWSNASSGCVQRLSSSTSTPTAAFTFTPASPQTGQAVSFDGSSSTDTGATITSYAWTFGDGSSATGVSPSHTYTQSGNFAAQLTITDSAGHTSSVSKTITVAAGGAGSPAPAFTFSPTTPNLRQAVTFDGSGSTDHGTTITSYSWSFGDGSTASGVTARHAYRRTGSYTVTLTIGDSSGHSASVTHTVKVN
jgi:PKD repeat protein